MVLTQARVCPARASVPECGPWRPGNGHVDRAVWARYEELLPVYRKRGSIVGDPSGGQLRAVLVAIWATGGKRALFRTGQGSVLASCFASHGEPCGTSALLDPAVEEGLSGHLRRLSRAALAGRPPPPLPTAVPEAPPAGLVAWARRVSGCGEGTAVVPPAPAAAHTFGNPDYADGISPSVRKPSPPVASRPGSSALGPAIPSGDLVLTAHRMSEALDARYPWRNGPSGRTRSLPRNADLLLSGRVERSVEGRSPPQVVRLQPSAFEEVTRLEAR